MTYLRAPWPKYCVKIPILYLPTKSGCKQAFGFKVINNNRILQVYIFTFDLNWPLTYLMELWLRQNLGFPINNLPANFGRNSTIFCKVIISSPAKWLGHVQLLLFSMGKPTGSWSYVVTSFFHGETIQNHESVTAVTTFSLITLEK